MLLAQRLEALRDLVDHLLAFVVLERGRASSPRSCTFIALTPVAALTRAVDADAIARRAAHQLVDRHAVGLARDVPQRLIDAARDRGLDRAAAIERAAVNRLPVEDDAARILADQVVADLQRAGGAGLGVVLEHLAPAGDAGIGRDLDEHPGVLQDEGFDLGDLDVVLRANLGRIGPLRVPGRCEAEGCGASEQCPEQCSPIDSCVGHRMTPLLHAPA